MSLVSCPSSAGGVQIPKGQKTTCQVPGCSEGLTALKRYHQRYKICREHMRLKSVSLNGVQQRWCQQCCRFHCLSEFDGEHRSCRVRLRKHTATRRESRRQRAYRAARDREEALAKRQKLTQEGAPEAEQTRILAATKEASASVSRDSGSNDSENTAQRNPRPLGLVLGSAATSSSTQDLAVGSQPSFTVDQLRGALLGPNRDPILRPPHQAEHFDAKVEDLPSADLSCVKEAYDMFCKQSLPEVPVDSGKAGYNGLIYLGTHYTRHLAVSPRVGAVFQVAQGSCGDGAGVLECNPSAYRQLRTHCPEGLSGDRQSPTGTSERALATAQLLHGLPAPVADVARLNTPYSESNDLFGSATDARNLQYVMVKFELPETIQAAPGGSAWYKFDNMPGDEGLRSSDGSHTSTGAYESVQLWHNSGMPEARGPMMCISPDNVHGVGEASALAWM